MLSNAASTVEQYLASLPADRRDELARVRATVNANLPPGYEEGMLYGMIGWYIPLERYPETYNGQPLCLAGLAAQKQHMALYMMTVYGDPAIEKAFRAGFAAAGKKLDMGKSCVRFTSADALALDVVGDTIAKVTPETHIARYEEVRAATKTGANQASRAKAKTARPMTSTTARAKSSSSNRVKAKSSSATTAKEKSVTSKPARSTTAKSATAKKSSTKSSSAKKSKSKSANTPKPRARR